MGVHSSYLEKCWPRPLLPFLHHPHSICTVSGRFMNRFYNYVLNHCFKLPCFCCCCLVTLKESEVKSLSHVQLFAIPWTVAYQAPRSMGFSRQEYWSGFPFLSPGDLPDPGSNRGLPRCRQTLYHWATREALACFQTYLNLYLLEKEMATHSSILAWKTP